MTARQQIARLLPLVLLVILVAAGLRGEVSAPRWNGPLKADGVAIGLALEVILAVLLIVTLRRDSVARRAAERRPYTGEDVDLEPSAALRFTLKWLLGACMVAVAVVLISDLHLHFLSKGKPTTPPPLFKGKPKTPPPIPQHPGGGLTLHIPWAPILYGLLVVALVAAVVVSIWWSSRLRQAAAPLVIEDAGAEELREAVESGRAALAEISDARAAIIACYVAMERSLADRGTSRSAADTPDELLARAVGAGTVRGPAAGRLTALFYEARFSTHPVAAGQRAAASAALDELAAELAAAEHAAAERAASAEQSAAAEQSAGPARPPSTPSTPTTGGGWV
jgi:hypothetical protein